MPESTEAFLRDLRSGRQRLLAVVAGVSEEQFKRRPAIEHVAEAGNWSIAEVLAHLLASEQRQGERLEGLLEGREAGALPVSDEQRHEEARLGRTVPVPQVIHGLLAGRRRVERALATPGATASEAVSRLVREDVIEHEAGHAAQIEAVRSVLGAVRAPRV